MMPLYTFALSKVVEELGKVDWKGAKGCDLKFMVIIRHCYT